MNINSTKQNRDVHTVTVDQDVALRIVAERVAEKLGVSLGAEGVSYRAHINTSDTSTGIQRNVFIEIIDDHTAKRTAG